MRVNDGRFSAARKINQPGKAFFRAEGEMRAGIAPGQRRNRTTSRCGHGHHAPAGNFRDQHQPVIKAGRHHFLLRMASDRAAQRLIPAGQFGWRLADGQHMRMAGYPAKTKSIAFTAKGRWLATSGADCIVLWPFFGGGPMGKAPTELAGGDQALCTRVACHPQQEVVAAGFDDGLVLIAEVASGRVVPVAAPGRGAVSALAWSDSGTHLAFGTEEGFAGLVDLSRR